MPRKRIIIGDVHGQIDALTALVDYHGLKSHYIFLGDYVDRGPAVRACLDIIMQIPKRTCLMGNHEDLMIRYLKTNDPNEDEDMDPAHKEAWLLPANGGAETLKSFGLDENATWSDLAVEYRQFLESLVYYYEDKDAIYVHAGIDPSEPDMKKQDPETLLWIRSPWLSSRKKWTGKTIFFGHTITSSYAEAERNLGLLATDNTFGIDTGAYYTGILTSVVFTGQKPFKLVQYDQDKKEFLENTFE